MYVVHVSGDPLAHEQYLKNKNGRKWIFKKMDRTNVFIFFK